MEHADWQQVHESFITGQGTRGEHPHGMPYIVTYGRIGHFLSDLENNKCKFVHTIKDDSDQGWSEERTRPTKSKFDLPDEVKHSLEEYHKVYSSSLVF